MNVITLFVAEAVTSSDAVGVVTADPVSTLIGNVLPSPFVKVIVLEATDAVTSNDPVFVATNGAQDAEIANDELNTELEPCGPYTFEAVMNDAVCALEAFKV